MENVLEEETKAKKISKIFEKIINLVKKKSPKKLGKVGKICENFEKRYKILEWEGKQKKCPIFEELRQKKPQLVETIIKRRQEKRKRGEISPEMDRRGELSKKFREYENQIG